VQINLYSSLLPLSILIITTVIFRKMPVVGKSIFPESDRLEDNAFNPRISVIIPARNEEMVLGSLLNSISKQSLMPKEIIVVDDHSEDRTASLAAKFGAKVIQAPDLPQGWLGKNWACWTGAKRAKGDLFLFLDADTVLEKEALFLLARAFDMHHGLVSIQPYHSLRRHYEKLSAFFNLILVFNMNISLLFRGLTKPMGAYGPCLLCSRKDYFSVGGHESVRTEILEDIALGRRFIQKKIPVHLFAGKGTISFRMYPQGLRQLVDGWTKNFASGAFSSNLVGLLLSFALITVCLSLPLNLIKGLINYNLILVLFWAGLYLLYAGQIYWVLIQLGNFGLATAIFYPLPLSFFIFIFFRSLVYTYLLGRVTWKGRKICFRRRQRRLLGGFLKEKRAKEVGTKNYT